MLARPDPLVLWTVYGFAFELWLPSDVSRAVQRAPDDWVLRRVRRSELAFHVELASATSSLWLATACNDLVGVEWRVRARPGDASLRGVDATLEELSDLLSRFEDETLAIRDLLEAWEPARQKPLLPSGSRYFSFLTTLRMDAGHAKHLRDELAGVRRLVEVYDVDVDDDPGGRTPEVPLARDATRDGLPAELLAIAPREHTHFVEMLRSFPSVAKLVEGMPRDARLSRWERTAHAYECAYTTPDGAWIAAGVPRGLRDPQLRIEQRAQRRIDRVASLWRAVLFSADERERAIGAIPEAERTHWQKSAYKEIGYVRSWAEVEAYGACDNRRMSAGETPANDPLLRLPNPPFPTKLARTTD